MSKFSGRYDFYDYLHAHKFTDEDIKNNLYIYIGKTKTPLEINDKNDLIQYYAYVPKKDKYDKKKKIAMVYLTDKSWVDIEEEQNLNISLNDIKKIYIKCKKKKSDFNEEDVLNQIYHKKIDLDVYKELIKRVKMDYKKADINGLHLIKFKYLRERLHSELEINGCIIPIE